MKEIIFAVAFWAVVGAAVVPGTYGLISAALLDNQELLMGAAVWIGLGGFFAVIIQITRDVARG